jgi:putative CocE/NonD family hydrolase
MYSVYLESRSLLTPDGIRLDADVYFPQGLGEFPVLLMRQPYGRTIASTVVYAHPQWYAQQGYIVVIQDVRGRGTSEGEFQLFAQEVTDGAVTINWAAELPGSSGAVGMYGFSYQGMTQLYGAIGVTGAIGQSLTDTTLQASDLKTSALKTLCPAMLAADLYADWAYEGGAFCWQLNLAWAIQLAAETARRSEDEEGFAALFQASRSLPVDTASPPGSPEVLRRYAPDSFYFDWLRHSDPADPYWQTLNPDLRAIDLPMLHIGGWFDPYLRGTLNLYQQMKQQSRHPQHLWIGPWTHLPWGQQAGSVNFGSAAQTPIDRLQLRWFDHFLKGRDTGLLTEDPVHCFDLGQKIWRTARDCPPPTPPEPTLNSSPHTWHLINTGLAALRTDEGLMMPSIPEIGVPETGVPEIPEVNQTSLPSCSAFLVHDPWRPVPALGGHGVIPGGSFNRQTLDDRSDVVTFTTAPFTAPFDLWGSLAVELVLKSPNPSFDVCAVLSVVRGEGVFNLTQGYRRVMAYTPQERIHLTLSLQPTCCRIASGECVRLSLSAACFPAYAINPGTGQDPHFTHRQAAQVITLEIHRGQLKIP